jgi:four helix bundle protein
VEDADADAGRLLGYEGLRVYQVSYQLAMEIFHLSKLFPKKETYSLTDQIRRSSRSVPTNVAEAYRKRRYPKHFVSKLTDADGEASETQVWLKFSCDCGYVSIEKSKELLLRYLEVGRMLGGMIANPHNFLPK